MELPAFPDIDAITDITGAPDGGLWVSKRGIIVHLNPESGKVRSFAPSDFSRNYNWYWNIHVDSAGGVVSYFKVPPGRYPFQARVRSASGVVAEPSLNLDIVILAPWWRRWWAWMIFVLVIPGAS